MWRTTPLHRTEVEGSAADAASPPLPANANLFDLQPAESGFGPFFHRRYRTRIRNSRVSAERLLDQVADDPDRVAPSEFATFRKLSGDEGAMREGDEYVVRMAGPWDGPVRVIRRERGRFRLATLDGHLEAGQIEFRAREEGEHVVFEIESWARSESRITDLLYDRLRMSKEVQLHMWTSTLERIVELSGGRMTGGIEIHTRRVDSSTIDA